jgi:hypothetical protein
MLKGNTSALVSLVSALVLRQPSCLMSQLFPKDFRSNSFR